MIILRVMQNAVPKQFKLTDEGVILFQSDATNPLPGKPVGKIGKGDAILKPKAALLDDAALPEGMDKEAALTKLNDWLLVHVHEVLQPLIALTDEEEIQVPAREIATSLHDAFGILPRADIETPIAALDEEGRRALRARKVRLGPILVFLPLLGKPAAVRLRALLWNIWNGLPLPAFVPPDGVTSISVADRDDIDPVYFRAIGYPVYGPRAIRVDMLDRLISAVYDSADKGVFKAKHEMAEWLGCPIPDLYAVLEAMDHKKIHDPADEAKAEEEKVEAGADAAAEEKPAEVAPVEEKAAAEAEEGKDEEKTAEEKPAVQPQEKPELATFRLRRGKAYGSAPRKPQYAKGGDKKPYNKKQGQDFKKRPHKGKRPPHKEQRERVISAVPEKKLENSPFAVLKDLKVQNKE